MHTNMVLHSYHFFKREIVVVSENSKATVQAIVALVFDKVANNPSITQEEWFALKYKENFRSRVYLPLFTQDPLYGRFKKLIDENGSIELATTTIVRQQSSFKTDQKFTTCTCRSI